MHTYPLSIRFRLLSITSRIDAKDASGRPVLFLKQKGFRFREDIDVWRDDSKSERLYRLKADRVIDFGATYHITGPTGDAIGAVRRQGVRSIWHATYDLLDASGQPVGRIHEENPWIKVLDAFLGAIPFVSMFINPAYLVEIHGREVLRAKKEPAFFEGKYTLEQRDKILDGEEDILLPSVLMMLILERQRG